MFDIERWKEIMSTLRQNKLRSFLTAFGVFWGIFMLIVMAGMGKGLENGVMQGIGDFATNSVFMWTDRTAKPYAGFRRGREWNFDNEDVGMIRQSINGVKIVAPRLFAGWGAGENTVRGNKAASFNLKGDYPEWIDINPMKVVEGRWINNMDIQGRRKVCVIGDKVYEQMFEKGEDPIGEYMRVDGVYYHVIGVIDPVTQMNMNGRAEESIFMPFTTMQVVYNYGDAVFMMGIVGQDDYSATALQEDIKLLIKSRHKIAPDDQQAIAGFSLEKEFKQFANLFLGIRILTWIVGIGTLIAGVIGVSNIMLVIVKARTKEIGVMRAIGATPRKVIGQILLESAFITTLAGYIGLFLGMLLLEGVSAMMDKAATSGADEVFLRNPEVSFTVAVSCLAILIVSGTLAGLIPAKKAVSIKPIDALRAE
jgi:putative ABC transport system permease protein